MGEYRTLHRAYRKLIAPYVDEARLREARAKVDFNWGRLISSTSGLDAPPLLQVER